MSGNSIGKCFKLTSFGESHGIAIGGVIEGCPAGLKLDFKAIQNWMDRRKPGQSELTSQRKEKDQVEFLSGIYEGITTGTPIGFLIKNKDHESKDYDHLKDTYRPSHADFTYQQKYGIRDHRGGGRSSARETACRVVAGAIAFQLLKTINVNIYAYVSKIGDIELNTPYKAIDLQLIDKNNVRCPNDEVADLMSQKIIDTANDGDTIGGEITGLAINVPAGWGEPIFDKLHAELGKAMLSINAVKSFKIGFESTDISSSKGSEVNDVLINNKGTTSTNYSGGIQGGISNGNDIYFEVAFKPVATIMKDQESVDSKGNKVIVEGKGRHDACVVPRAVPIVEAMLSLVLVDHYLRSKTAKL